MTRIKEMGKTARIGHFTLYWCYLLIHNCFYASFSSLPSLAYSGMWHVLESRSFETVASLASWCSIGCLLHKRRDWVEVIPFARSWGRQSVALALLAGLWDAGHLGVYVWSWAVCHWSWCWIASHKTIVPVVHMYFSQIIAFTNSHLYDIMDMICRHTLCIGISSTDFLRSLVALVTSWLW